MESPRRADATWKSMKTGDGGFLRGDRNCSRLPLACLGLLILMVALTGVVWTTSWWNAFSKKRDGWWPEDSRTYGFWCVDASGNQLPCALLNAPPPPSPMAPV